MAFETGTASGHQDLLIKLNTFVTATLPVAERWTLLRDKTWNGQSNELFMWKAPGLSGTEEIFLIAYNVQDVGADYYNTRVSAATGYLDSNDIFTQPGDSGRATCPMWQFNIPYWFVGDGQGVVCFVNIDNHYMSFVIGKFLAYSAPNQYNYPVVRGAMLDGSSNLRYSDASYTAWWKGNNARLKMRFVDGNWRSPEILPYSRSYSERALANSSGSPTLYHIPHTLEMSENVSGYVNNYGIIPNVYQITGFANSVESTFTANGENYIVMRDSNRTGFGDYCALRLV